MSDWESPGRQTGCPRGGQIGSLGDVLGTLMGDVLGTSWGPIFAGWVNGDVPFFSSRPGMLFLSKFGPKN